MIRTPADPAAYQRAFYRFWFPEWPECRVLMMVELWRIFYART